MVTTASRDVKPPTCVLDRMPPADLDSERALLGSCILSPELLDELANVVSPADFYDDSHQVLFSALHDLHGIGRKIDPLLLRTKLQEDGTYERIGGAAYLVKVFQSVPNAAHGPYYANSVRKRSIIRQLIAAASDTIRDAYDPGCDPETVLDHAESAFSSLSERSAPNEALTAKSLMSSALSEIDARIGHSSATGVQTGFGELDVMTGGLRPGQLVILAGRTGMGKTAMALNVTLSAAKGGLQVVFFSLEMSSIDLGERLLSIDSRVSLHKMRGGYLAAGQRERIVESAGSVSRLPILVLDDAMQSVRRIGAYCRRVKRKGILGLVVVDYLQLVEPSDRRIPRQEQVAAITRALKAMAKDLSVPVLCLAQLNRQVEQTQGNRPKLSQLRESGSIEQDSDLVLFIHRDEYYLPPGDKKDDAKGKANLIVAKQRNGPTGEVELVWLAESASFVDKAPERHQTFDSWNAAEPKNDWQEEAF